MTSVICLEVLFKHVLTQACRTLYAIVNHKLKRSQYVTSKVWNSTSGSKHDAPYRKIRKSQPDNIAKQVQVSPVRRIPITIQTLRVASLQGLVLCLT